MTATTPHNLLPASRAFVGREAEIGALLERVGRERVTWLTGPAGIGKTELVRCLGHRAREGGLFPGGIFHLSLEGAGRIVTLTGDLVFTLSIDETKPPAQVFAGPPCLFLWDQMDGVRAHAPERIREVIEERLAEAPHVHHLIVCRADVPGPDGVRLKGLGPEDAERAFVNHLPPTVSARPEPGDADLAEALGRLGGNPLAIRLAARWCRPPRWTPVLPEGLAEAAGAVSALPDDPLGRGLALAVADLDEPARRLLGLLAALPGGGLGNSLYAVFGEDWEAPAGLLEATGLTETYADRHVLHPAARTAAAEVLGPRTGASLADQAAFHLQQTLVECATQLRAGHSESSLYFIVREWDNLRATYNGAVDRLHQASDVDEDEEARLVVDYGLAMFHLFYSRRMLSEGLLWTRTSLEAAQRIGLEVETATLTDYAGLFHVQLGHQEEAAACFTAAGEAYAAVEGDTGVGTAAYHLGLLHFNLGQWGPARAAFEKALELLRRLPQRAFAAHSATYLGQILLAEDDVEGARELLTEALALYEEGASEPELRIAARFALAQAAARTGHMDESLEQAAEAMVSAFQRNPRSAGAAVPQILKLAHAFVQAGGGHLEGFVQGVVGLVGQLRSATPRPEFRDEWQLACRLLERVAGVLILVGAVYGTAEVAEAEREKARDALPGAARALDEVTGGLLGAEAWVQGLAA